MRKMTFIAPILLIVLGTACGNRPNKKGVLDQTSSAQISAVQVVESPARVSWEVPSQLVGNPFRITLCGDLWGSESCFAYATVQSNGGSYQAMDAANPGSPIPNTTVSVGPGTVSGNSRMEFTSHSSTGFLPLTGVKAAIQLGSFSN